MFGNIKRIKELEKENEELRKELEIKTTYIKRMRNIYNECESMKNEWRKAITDAKIAQKNFEELYNTMLKMQ